MAKRTGNLPAEPTSFVGRERELIAVTSMLQMSRLVTIAGMPGVGKTRLALRAARIRRREYPDGVWYVDLAPIRDPALVSYAIADALRLADTSPRSSQETLLDYLADRTSLLVLDTCEHLVEACSELIDAVLRTAPGIRVLTTSHQALTLPGEHALVVPPLGIPPALHDLTPDQIEGYEAVQLFVERARAVDPYFALDDYTAPRVSELCRRLDGIPLAIELAAVRLRGHSLDQLLTRTAEQRFGLLAGGSRTTSRHDTLRSAIGWSHELCSPAEKRLWAYLSVFAGDFDFAAAQYVCTNFGADLLDLVSSLVDKSILLREDHLTGVRYRLPESIREYGADWLAELAEGDRLPRRHRDYYVRLARRANESWSGRAQFYWFVRMNQERSNIRTALEFCMSHRGESQTGLALAADLWFLWVACGMAREGRYYLRRAIEANPVPSADRCRALWVSAYVANSQGDIETAKKLAGDCGMDAARIGDTKASVYSIKMLGTAAMIGGDWAHATAYLGTAIGYYQVDEELNPGLLPATVELALTLTGMGEPDQAIEILSDCRDLCVERGELWLRSYADYAFAQAWRARGEFGTATASAREALRIKRHFHDVLGVVLCLELLAWLSVFSVTATAAMAGSRGPRAMADRAARLLGASEANWSMFGLPLFEASPFFDAEHKQAAKEARRLLGEQDYQEGYTRGAALGLDEAIAYAVDEGDNPGGSMGAVGLGGGL